MKNCENEIYPPVNPLFEKERKSKLNNIQLNMLNPTIKNIINLKIVKLNLIQVEWYIRFKSVD